MGKLKKDKTRKKKQPTPLAQAEEGNNHVHACEIDKPNEPSSEEKEGGEVGEAGVGEEPYGQEGMNGSTESERSPFILVEHKLGISFWCVSSLLSYATSQFDLLSGPYFEAGRQELHLGQTSDSKERRQTREQLMYITQCILMVRFPSW